MTSLREAAQQALEALEDEPNAMVEWKPNHWEYKRNLAITALRTALAEPQEKYTWGTPLLDAFLLAPEPGQLKDRGQE
jgi:hypothetical protein